MITKTYKTSSGRTLLKPIAETEEEMSHLANFSDEGFCLSCGSTQGGVEPDARKYECEACGEKLVHGFQELLLMGLFDLQEDQTKETV